MALDLIAAVLAALLGIIVLQSRNQRTAVGWLIFLVTIQEIARPIRVFTSVFVSVLFLAELFDRLTAKRRLGLFWPMLILPVATIGSLLVHPTIDHPFSRLKGSGIFLSYLGAIGAAQLVWWHVTSAADAVRILRRFTAFVLIGSLSAVLIAAFGYTESIADLQAELQAEAGLPRFAERAFLFFRHPNQNAYFAALGIFFLLARALTAPARRNVEKKRSDSSTDSALIEIKRQWQARRVRERTAIILALGFLTITANLLLTGSRGAILAVPLAVLASLYVAGRTRLAVTSTLGITVAVPIVFVLLIGLGTGEAATMTEGEQLGSRLRDITSPGSALNTRPILWEGAFNAFLSSPILGVGPTNLPYMFLYRTPRMMTWSEDFLATAPAHSLYLHLLATTGILGLIGFFVLAVVVFHRMRKRARTSASPESQELGYAGLFSLLFLVIVGALGHTVFGIYYFNTAIFFLVFALALTGSKQHSETRSHATS